MINTENRNTQPYRRLLRKYLAGECTPAERKIVEAWYDKYVEEKLAANGETKTGQKATKRIDAAGIRMWSRIELGIREPKRLKTRPTWMNVAASVAVVLFAGYLWTIIASQKSETNARITSGKTAATITLDREGSGIYLDTALQTDALRELGIDVRYEDGKPFYAVAPAIEQPFEEYTISTNKGEEIQIMLPDQSKVWINASSKITFDSDFGVGAYRDIRVEGEAYFEVAHNAERPFRVHAKQSIIEVLGTSFNVNAYGNHPYTETTLLEGSVHLHDQTLTPGQQAVFDGESMLIEEVDTENFVAWKNGFFNFNGVGLPKIIAQLENWYNVEFELSSSVSGERIHGMIPKYQDLQSVLNILEKAGMGKFKIEGRRVTVMS